MSLDSSQLASLLSVISEENTSTQTFEALASSFHQFFNKSDFFKIGCALVTLLQNKDLLVHPTQRIVCIHLLYDMYRTDQIASNPFACVFISLVNPPSPVTNQNGSAKEFNWSMPRLTPQEKFFVSQIISTPPKDLFKKTPSQILQLEPANLHSIDISALQVSIVEKISELPHISKVGIPCILSDVEVSRYGFDEVAPKNGSDAQKLAIETLLIGQEAAFNKCIKPEFIRLAPPMMPITTDELLWLDPIDFEPEFAWDNTILSSATHFSNTSEIQKLISKAYKVQLNINQQKQLENSLSKDPAFVLHADLTPEKFASLVEVNPLIAVKMIISYQCLDSSDLSPYLEELLKMKMSVHSMEVVNKLAKLVILPDEFIHLYISTCISKCENMSEDRSLQSRLVRLLCVFIQSLIRTNIIDVKELYIELQPFCMEFSGIREAATLFRLLRTIDNQSATGTSAPSGSTSTSNS